MNKADDILARLQALATDEEKRELTIAHNGRINAMRAYNDRPGKATRADYETAAEFAEQTIARLQSKYFPGEAEKSEKFKNRATAFEWYKAEGGSLEQASFYKKVPCAPDKTVSALWLSEFLRKEKEKFVGQSSAVLDYAERKAAMDLEEQQLKIDKLRREGRKDDREYIKRDLVHEREGALIGTILGEIRYQVGRSVPAIITTAHGQPERAPDVSRLLEETVYDAFRVIYESGEVDITFEDELQD